MGKKLAIEHQLVRPNEVIELLEMMGGKNTDNADGCSFLYYTLCTPKINNPNNDKVICGFTNLKMQNDFFAIFTLEKFWKKYPYKLNDLVLCNDGLLGVVTKMEWDCEKSDMKYFISFKMPVDNKWYSSKNIKYKFMEAKSKKLAIKGHPTRGKEVIELLEMMGGRSMGALRGNTDWYIIDEDENNLIKIYGHNYIRSHEFVVLTLEEFWEKYPFKVGDKVIDEADGCPGVVCEMKWDEGLSDMKYCVAFGNGVDFGWFANGSINFFKIKKNENLEKTQSKREYDELRMPLDDDDKLATEVTIMGKRILPPDGYLVGKITQTDNGMLVEYVVEKKPKYPTTYAECCDVLSIAPHYNLRYYTYEHGYNEYATTNKLCSLQDKLNILGKLIICRDAYWKIAGEELELDKPWEPDWNGHEFKYGLKFMGHRIEKTSEMTVSHVICFPTEEMRDAFYENFKKEIEQCKELL